MKTTTCRGCGRPIMWIMTPGGKPMPCDTAPVYYKLKAKGPDKIVTPEGVTVSCEIVATPGTADGYGFMPHWATCPEAGKFKRTNRKEETR